MAAAYMTECICGSCKTCSKIESIMHHCQWLSLLAEAWHVE